MTPIVLYSSRTGNTEKVARAMAAALPEGTPCCSVTDLPSDWHRHRPVFLGFWVDRGTADAATRCVLPLLQDADIAIFATLGADPASDHARLSLEAASSLLPRSSRLLGTFCCRGRVDPELVKKMYEMFPPQSLHGRNPASESRIRAASTHPDETDLAQAAAFARRMMEKE